MELDEQRRFEQATLPHLDAAYNLARWLTQDAHVAEDVVQDAFCRAAQYFHSFRGGNGRAWFLTIIRRLAFDWLAKRRSHVEVNYSEEMHDRADVTFNPEYLAIRQCDEAAVRRAMEELPATLREVLALRELEGMSYHEIAAVTELPIGTVTSRLSRARDQLQQRLAPSQQEGIR